jgi:hypothetical protein
LIAREVTQYVQSADARQGDVQQQQLRMKRSRQSCHIPAVTSLPDDCEIRIRLKQPAQPCSKDGMIVRYEHANR